MIPQVSDNGYALGQGATVQLPPAQAELRLVSTANGVVRVVVEVVVQEVAAVLLHRVSQATQPVYFAGRIPERYVPMDHHHNVFSVLVVSINMSVFLQFSWMWTDQASI